MIWTLIKVLVLVVVVVVVVGKLPARTETRCVATVTADDGTVVTVPCR